MPIFVARPVRRSFIRRSRGALLVFVLVTALSCVTIGRRVIEVTPGPVPQQLQGARWDELPARYCFVASEAGFLPHARFVELTNEAFARWGVESVSEGDCDEAKENNERNEITWGEAPEQSASPVQETGYARLLYSRCVQNCPNGAETRIVEADILIDPSPPEYARTEACLFSTLLHESGHFLGVHHLSSPAVMAPVSTTCPQELTVADKEAIAALYELQAFR